MKTLTFITGGERSGKSRFAQELALKRSVSPVYVATARVWDEDFSERIEKHKEDRDRRWKLLEEEKYISQLNTDGSSVVLIDCVTLWLTNFFTDNNYAVENTFDEISYEWKKLAEKSIDLIVVSNEIGMGLHATTPSGRKFVELQGRLNQLIASEANEVYFMVSGIPLKIK